MIAISWIKVYLLVMMVINISLVAYLYYSQFLYKCGDLITTAPEKEQGLAVEWKCISYQSSKNPVSPTYTNAFLLNVDLARILCPGWKIYLYLDTHLNGSDVHNIATSFQSDIVTILWKSYNVSHISCG